MMRNEEMVEMFVAVDDDRTEVSLIVRAPRALKEDEFINAVLDFLDHSEGLDFSQVIGDLREEDLDLN